MTHHKCVASSVYIDRPIPPPHPLTFATVPYTPLVKALNAAEMRLQACTERLQELQSMFDNQMAEKKRIEDGALALQRKMNQVRAPTGETLQPSLVCSPSGSGCILNTGLVMLSTIQHEAQLT